MDKLKEIVQYICYQFSTISEQLDLVKINKICWFSDIDWKFLTANETISEFDTYVKEYQGPVLPAIETCINDLKKENQIAVNISSDSKKHYISSQEPPLLLLSNYEQKKVLDFWINYAQSVSSDRISDESHDYSWWDKIDVKSAIPVELGLLKQNPIKGSLLHYESPLPKL